jgi:alanine dehydrogenase
VIVGTVSETKTEEHRVALTPPGVAEIVRAGHTLLVEAGAGLGSSYEDQEYGAVGAEIVETPDEVYARADLVCEVKEPQPEEFAMLRAGQVIFTYLHLAAAPDVTRAMLDSECIGIAYETVRAADGSLPLLQPMSEVAGRMAVEIGSQLLRRPGPGRGLLLGGLASVAQGHVVVIGSGNVGRNAVRVAVGLGARVSVLSIDANQLRDLDELYQGRVDTSLSTPDAIARVVRDADLLIGAVLVEGDRAPTVVTREMVSTMRSGAVIVDVAVDQGGCIETTRPTDHTDPIYVVDGVVHYAVPNMPGAVPRTSSKALAGMTLPYVLRIANDGVERAIVEDPALAHGVNIYRGHVTHPRVAEALALPYTALSELVKGATEVR